MAAKFSDSSAAAAGEGLLEPPPSSGHLHLDFDHPTSSLTAMDKMRDNRQLCDVLLRVGDRVTRAHRLVLASSSSYFYAMFNSDMAERGQSEVKLQDVDADAVALLVEFAYTGRVHVTEHNVRALLSTSSFLQMDSVRDACCDFLTQHLCPNNCLDVARFADTHYCTDLGVRSRLFALKHFEQVSATEEFLGLPYADVKDLVSDDRLNVASEDRVFVAAARWIHHDLPDRARHQAPLMRHMRLVRMSKTFLSDVVYNDPVVRTDPGCRNLLLDTAMYHLLPDDRKSEFSAGALQTKRRTGCLVPYVFAVGGTAEERSPDGGECYDQETDSWLPIAPMLNCRRCAGVAALGNLIYACGGYNERWDSLSSAECYDPSCDKWSAVTPLRSVRSGLGMAAFRDHLYVCGGHDYSSYLNTVDRYDPQTGAWYSCPGMTTNRVGCSVSVLDDCVYALGGRRDNDDFLCTAERYDPRMSRWMRVPDMSNPRSSNAAATLDDALYCAGGEDDYRRPLRSVERLNVRRNAWETVASMECARSYEGMVAVDDGLLVLGGGGLNTAERYDPPSDRWTPVTPPRVKRGSVGAVILYRCETDLKLLAAVSSENG